MLNPSDQRTTPRSKKPRSKPTLQKRLERALAAERKIYRDLLELTLNYHDLPPADQGALKKAVLEHGDLHQSWQRMERLCNPPAQVPTPTSAPTPPGPTPTKNLNLNVDRNQGDDDGDDDDVDGGGGDNDGDDRDGEIDPDPDDADPDADDPDDDADEVTEEQILCSRLRVPPKPRVPGPEIFRIKKVEPKEVIEAIQRLEATEKPAEPEFVPEPKRLLDMTTQEYEELERQREEDRKKKYDYPYFGYIPDDIHPLDRPHWEEYWEKRRLSGEPLPPPKPEPPPPPDSTNQGGTDSQEPEPEVHPADLHGPLLPTNGAEYTPEPVPKMHIPVPEEPQHYDHWGIPIPKEDPFRKEMPNPSVIAGAKQKAGELVKQLGLLGQHAAVAGRLIALNLGVCLSMAFFGVNEVGKSYLLGVIVEMFLQAFPGLNRLLKAPCVAYFHFHASASCPPELLTSVYPNVRKEEVENLVKDYGAKPDGLKDVLVLTLMNQVEAARHQYPHAQVQAIRFPLRELGIESLRALLGFTSDNKSLYARQVESILHRLIETKKLNFNDLLDSVLKEPMELSAKRLLLNRLELVRPWVDDEISIRSYIKRGRLIIVDLRDEWMDPEQAMILCNVINSALALHPDQYDNPNAIPLVMAYDELHKFIHYSCMKRQLSLMIRERRHLKLNLILSSQDPQSLPGELLELQDVVGIMHHKSKEWVRYLSRHIDDFRALTVKASAALQAGSMWLWAKDYWTDEQDGALQRSFCPLVPVLIRPRATFHGGETRSLLD